MTRILVVVASFVVLNTVGFIAYRSSRPVAAAHPAPQAEPTLSAPARLPQPKPTESTAHTVAPSAPSDVADPAVSKPTDLPERVVAKPLAAQPTRTVPIKRRAPEPVTNRPTEKKPQKDGVLDMDENPYKRGE